MELYISDKEEKLLKKIALSLLLTVVFVLIGKDIYSCRDTIRFDATDRQASL
jgi:hypothetical protein